VPGSPLAERWHPALTAQRRVLPERSEGRTIEITSSVWFIFFVRQKLSPHSHFSLFFWLTELSHFSKITKNYSTFKV
jgi:hypothetical protein